MDTYEHDAQWHIDRLQGFEQRTLRKISDAGGAYRAELEQGLAQIRRWLASYGEAASERSSDPAYRAEFARKDRALMDAAGVAHEAAGRDHIAQWRIAEQYRADLEALDAAYLAGRDLP